MFLEAECLKAKSKIRPFYRYNRLTLRRWWMSGKLPTPIKLNGTTRAWHTETINHWIQQNVNKIVG